MNCARWLKNNLNSANGSKVFSAVLRAEIEAALKITYIQAIVYKQKYDELKEVHEYLRARYLRLQTKLEDVTRKISKSDVSGRR